MPLPKDGNLRAQLTPPRGEVADARLNLRLSLQNCRGTDTRRFASAWNGATAWQLDTREAGQRTWLLSLEGKW